MLASPELQNKKRTSFNPLLKAYLLDIFSLLYYVKVELVYLSLSNPAADVHEAVVGSRRANRGRRSVVPGRGQGLHNRRLMHNCDAVGRA